MAAGHWARAAQMEHASVASFARFSLQLMSIGAPLPLLQAAHQAALDEVKHAQIAISFANKLGGTNIVPGDFPVSDKTSFGFGDLPTIAEATTLEGCVEETIAALIAAVQAERVSDPEMQAALKDVAKEEATHAVLAWRSLQWMLQKSPAIREKIAAVISSTRPVSGSSEVPASTSLEAVGILSAEKMEKLREIGWHRIVAPTASSLGLLSACEEASEDIDQARSIRSMIAVSMA